MLKGLCGEEKETDIWKVRKLRLEGEISMSTWSRKLKRLFKESAQLRKRLSESEADMDFLNWEQRNSDNALCETNRELESQRLELYQANQWADQAQRGKINLFGEMEMRNGFFQESRARHCQEIGEFR